jgi:hypothetical protein
MNILAVVVIAAVLFLPASAAADSDGYFCAGRGYLAYAMRFAATPSKHELHVVRFGGTSGIVVAQPVLLDDFQVHGMRCLSGAVELIGWETVYSVDISGARQPATIARSAAPVAGQATAEGNLGHWAKPQVMTLDAEGEALFQLVIARVSQRVSSGVEHHTVSRLIQRGTKGFPRGEIIRSLQVFEGVFLETID